MPMREIVLIDCARITPIFAVDISKFHVADNHEFHFVLPRDLFLVLFFLIILLGLLVARG